LYVIILNHRYFFCVQHLLKIESVCEKIKGAKTCFYEKMKETFITTLALFPCVTDLTSDKVIRPQCT